MSKRSDPHSAETASTPNAEGATAGQARPPKTVAQMLGEIVWLMTQSPVHRQLFVGDLEWFCMPAILLEQFRLFHGPQAPAAVALWASVSDDTQARLMAGGYKLRADEWKNGENLWLIELVAPFGAQDEIMRDLKSSVFAGKRFRFHNMNDQGQRVVTTVEPTVATSVN